MLGLLSSWLEPAREPLASRNEPRLKSKAGPQPSFDSLDETLNYSGSPTPFPSSPARRLLLLQIQSRIRDPVASPDLAPAPVASPIRIRPSLAARPAPPRLRRDESTTRLQAAAIGSAPTRLAGRGQRLRASRLRGLRPRASRQVAAGGRRICALAASPLTRTVAGPA